MSYPDFIAEARLLIGKSFDVPGAALVLEVWYLKGKIQAGMEHMAVPRILLPGKEAKMAKKAKTKKKAKKKATY